MTTTYSSKFTSGLLALLLVALSMRPMVAAAQSYQQPTISNFSPSSGAVGTIVTVNGAGLTGVNAAWVGNARNAAVTVVSDAQVRITVPAGATTGAIGIFNPLYASFAPGKFTVSTTTATAYAQPGISGFAPASGAVGTVVIVTGRGFTGANAAWVGNARNVGVTVASDTQLTLTVPAGATTGAIGIFNPLYTAFAPGTFTVTTSTAPAPAPAPAPNPTPTTTTTTTTTPTTSTTYTQPSISGFTPASGAIGTVVTVNGRGFTGSNNAWVGNAHNAGVAVASDTQVKVTIPAGATTGSIGIFNPKYVAFAPGTFTVSAGTAPTPTPTPTYAQPGISSFAPASGAAGTVVTVTGSGFTGVNEAWVGSGRVAAPTVVSNTQVTLTVPADATSGVIALMNPANSASSTANFTVSVSAPPAPPTSGTLSLRVQGNRFIDAAGNVVQLRGVNYSGFEFAAIGGWSGNDPSGGQAGQPGGPKWSALQSWKVNALRIPLNEASWQNRTCVDTSGAMRDADPADNYQAAVREQVRQANAAGLYVILDLHWSAPGNTCPMLQTQMANADNSLPFWTSVASTFKNNPAVVFELFNEPFMNFGFSGDTWAYMMQGTGGSFSSFPATSPAGGWKQVNQPWAIASYQAMLNAVRATGATNVVLVGTLQYAQELSGWLAHRTNDPLNQMGVAWHPYQKFQSAWDYPYPNFYPEVMTDAQNILAAGIPMVMTEVGGRNAPGTPSSPIVTTMTGFADANGIGVLGWTWGVWGETEHVLIKDVNGTPTDGYGVVYRNWMLAH